MKRKAWDKPLIVDLGKIEAVTFGIGTQGDEGAGRPSS